MYFAAAHLPGGSQMPTDQRRPTEERTLRVLTREELDDRIHRLAGWIAEGSSESGGSGNGSDDGLDPRWISAAELIRRVRPFLVYN